LAITVHKSDNVAVNDSKVFQYLKVCHRGSILKQRPTAVSRLKVVKLERGSEIEGSYSCDGEDPVPLGQRSHVYISKYLLTFGGGSP
jgi:hypothetical protein